MQRTTKHALRCDRDASPTRRELLKSVNEERHLEVFRSLAVARPDLLTVRNAMVGRLFQEKLGRQTRLDRRKLTCFLREIEAVRGR